MLERESPDGVIVVGDVNSTVGCALVAAKMHVPVIHVEAGLRSFDRTMPEEINRLVTDAITDVYLVTEASGLSNLRAEGVSGSRAHMVGNLMIDTLLFNLERSRLAPIGQTLSLQDLTYGVVTLHRPGNVDDEPRFSEIMSALLGIYEELPLYFPVHPQTRAKLSSIEWPPSARVTLIDPLGYLDFLHLVSRSAAVLTDSGGVPEETTALGIPCLTLRENTERPITVVEGSNRLAGISRLSILDTWRAHCASPKAGRVPALWDSKAAERSLAVLRSYYHV